MKAIEDVEDGNVKVGRVPYSDDVHIQAENGLKRNIGMDVKGNIGGF